MRRTVTGFLVAAALLAGGLVSQTRQQEIDLQAAIRTETVDGDLKAAIRQYGVIAAKYKDDRAIAAKALLQMAECHQKLGDSEARKIYERVVREYADQKEAVLVARARLGGVAAKNSGIVTRQVWTRGNANPFAMVSPDGRSISFADWTTNNLAVHDIASGTDRLLTNKGTRADSPEYAESSSISRDSRQVAYAWYSKGRYELLLASLSGDPNPRRLFDNEDVQWIAPYDWTPDGQWIAVQVERKDGTKQLGLVSSSTGTLRVLKSIDWRGSTRMYFSPDGQYLAYDLTPGDASEQRDIFLLATDGSREIPAVVHPGNDVVMGWAPDGRRLLFASDRTGAVGLWSLNIAGSKPQGAPELLKPDMGGGEGFGLTRSGALYFGVAAGTRDIVTASVDFNSGEVSPAFSQPVSSHLGKNTWPSWSPDGKLFAYFTNRDPRGLSVVLNVRSLDTEKTKSFSVDLNHPYFPRWLPSGRGICVRAADRKGRMGIYRIDVATGEVSPVQNGSGNMIPAGWSPDEKKLYALRQDPASQEWLVVERDLTSGTERELLRRKDHWAAMVSPDGRHLAYVARDRAAKSSAIMILPVAGGEAKELLRLEASVRGVNVLEWTPDSRSIVFRQRLSPVQGDPEYQEPELWVVSTAGGPPRKIGLKARGIDLWQLRIHPDGSQIAFVAGQPKYEIWAMENFLPALSASK